MSIFSNGKFFLIIATGMYLLIGVYIFQASTENISSTPVSSGTMLEKESVITDDDMKELEDSFMLY
jgi:hypothetical protein